MFCRASQNEGHCLKMLNRGKWTGSYTLSEHSKGFKRIEMLRTVTEGGHLLVGKMISSQFPGANNLIRLDGVGK